MTVALAVQRMAPPLLAEVRAACRALGLVTEDWQGGIPRTPPLLVISALEPGERQLPDDVIALIEAAPGIRAIVCASEPLVKPRIALGNGRVVLLAPPVDRVRLIAVIRGTIGADDRTQRGSGQRRFEVLRRQYWVAWARGAEGMPVTLDEQGGLTVIVGPASLAPTVVRTLGENLSDAKCGDKLAERVGDAGAVIHLVEESAEWLVYWPATWPLWLSSPQRLPSRWSATEALAASRNHMLRVPAFPGDQLLGTAVGQVPPAELFTPLKDVMLEGGPETLSALSTMSDQVASLAGVVVELR